MTASKKPKRININRVSKTVSGVLVRNLRFDTVLRPSSADYVEIITGEYAYFCDLAKCTYWIHETWALNGSHLDGIFKNLKENEKKVLMQLSLF